MDIVPTKALEVAWVVDTAPTKAPAVAWVAADIALTKVPAVAWAVAVAIVLMKAQAVAWEEAVDIDPTKALVGAWVEVVDIVPMKVLDMGDPMATDLMMSPVTEATTIEGHPLMSTVAMMALAMEEGVTEGTMAATAMEEVRRLSFLIWLLVSHTDFWGMSLPRVCLAEHEVYLFPACIAVHNRCLSLKCPTYSLKGMLRVTWKGRWGGGLRVALTS